jgi:hypothetical protein
MDNEHGSRAICIAKILQEEDNHGDTIEENTIRERRRIGLRA